MKLFAKKTKDERVVAETNRIYKVGYLILSFGIGFDLYLQLAGAKDGQFSLRMVEFGVLMLAQFVCLVLMVRKGLAEDSRYAEADVFPKKHYALLGLGAGAAASVVFLVLRMLAFPHWEFGAKAFVIVMGVTFLSMTLCIAVCIYALQYFVFRMARRRRAKMQEDDDMKP